MQVAIANPRLGGARRTSVRRAMRFVRRGMAVWLPDGRIRFVEKADVRSRSAEMRQTLREEAREFAVNRGGILFWNGTKDPSAMFRPGEVRS
jgi:hypothetical protein